MKYGLFLSVCMTPADDYGFAGCRAFSRVANFLEI